MKIKAKLTEVRYIYNIPTPIFSGYSYYGGKKISGNIEQLICSLAEIVAEKPKINSKKAIIVPGSEKLSYDWKITKCTKTFRSFDFFDQRKDYETVEINFDKEFPRTYFKRGKVKINVELEVEFTNMEWNFKTTRARLR